MLRVTFDTLVAERADGTALIHAAWRGGYDVALVEITQAPLTSRSLRVDDEPVMEPSDSTTALQLSTQLLRVTGRDGNELVAETWGEGLVLSFSPIIGQLLSGGLTPGRRSPAVPKDLRVYSRLPQILHIIGRRSRSPRGVSTPFTPVQRHHLREAASLFAHSHAQRDIFVSENTEAFVRDGRRQALTRLLQTRILTPGEFQSLLTRHKRCRKSPGEASGEGG
jgi:hypothetical protein